MTVSSADDLVSDHRHHRRSHGEQLRLEGLTMALYVSVYLLAALAALDEDLSDGGVRALGLVWGTALGLTLAHAFAFQLAARLANGGASARGDAEEVAAQFAGAGAVAALVSIPVLILPSSAGYDAARLMLALLIGCCGLVVSRLAGRGSMRSLAFGAAALAVAFAVALLKNILSVH